MYLQDQTGGDITDFYNIYLQYIYALNQRPEIQMAYSTFNINFPQYMVDIDAAKAKRAGISPTEILSTFRATTADSTCRTSTASRKYIA